MDRRVYALLLTLGVAVAACSEAPTTPPDRSRLIPKIANAATAPRSAAPPTAARPSGARAEAAGTGAVASGTDNANFAFEAAASDGAAADGQLTASGTVDGAAFRLEGKVAVATFATGLVTLEGRGTFNGVPARFAARAQDGSPDAFALAIATDARDYMLAGTLTRGEVVVEP